MLKILLHVETNITTLATRISNGTYSCVFQLHCGILFVTATLQRTDVSRGTRVVLHADRAAADESVKRRTCAVHTKHNGIAEVCIYSLYVCTYVCIIYGCSFILRVGLRFIGIYADVKPGNSTCTATSISLYDLSTTHRGVRCSVELT